MSARRPWAGPLESVALLTVVRVPAAAAASTRGVLPWAPLVGLALGGGAAGVGVLGAHLVSPLAGAVAALAALAALTRALHLDGLADTADGLGPLRGRERALQVMHQGDVGPFGVVTLVLTLLVQAAAGAALLERDGGWLALWTAVAVARLAMARTGLPGVPTAAGSELGRAVAGTVSAPWLAAWVLTVGVLAGAAAWLVAGPGAAAALVGASAAGLLAAEGVRVRATARLGGITGDVMGAMGEAAATVVLVVAAASLP
ncbi:adenosylcobinamide-GDP ribazoletransferase [Geodermatophilus bullaregiensis]|uniref:adenosylcobinamide-GDP ribazoletransferase n=1 Tax=Geodermatophilus bullaregiensis TaxID=1564160 RepID=UPI0027DD9C8E|nr:adenosylcobinamide-GDP ribazoletransferase [Geodermatophilus bullaregiensis]MBM7807168.1 adenosylcobinamide-GDP ribazoletransferase [Geodermatophilus bullaregiensis]